MECKRSSVQHAKQRGPSTKSKPYILALASKIPKHPDHSNVATDSSSNLPRGSDQGRRKTSSPTLATSCPQLFSYIRRIHSLPNSLPSPFPFSFPFQEDVGEEAVVWKEENYFTYILNNRGKNGYYIVYLQTKCIKMMSKP